MHSEEAKWEELQKQHDRITVLRMKIDALEGEKLADRKLIKQLQESNENLHEENDKLYKRALFAEQQWRAFEALYRGELTLSGITGVETTTERKNKVSDGITDARNRRFPFQQGLYEVPANILVLHQRIRQWADYHVKGRNPTGKQWDNLSHILQALKAEEDQLQ